MAKIVRLSHQRVLVILANFVSDPLAHVSGPNSFRVAWPGKWPSGKKRDVVAEIQTLLPKGWVCRWNGEGDAETSVFTIELE